jgi:hypothetical protein
MASLNDNTIDGKKCPSGGCFETIPCFEYEREKIE